ncbi:hypothetical protein C8N40_102453 [Pontibacter mucosus]|uniref:Uncharacterized protein n=1 Tax=Pontibacter mucosus TaxID=1649266 RepID=A0A2T5YQ91_9BACT|nr:hypothetical protein C8N40_102453 [Pontibacter mucosus]
MHCFTIAIILQLDLNNTDVGYHTQLIRMSLICFINVPAC